MRIESDEAEIWDESWSPGVAFVPTQGLAEALHDCAGTIGYGGDASLPAFLVARLSTPTGGTVLLVRRAGAWGGIAAEAGHAPQGVFVSPGGGRVIVVTMLAREGPGDAYLMLRSSDGLASVQTVEIAFPEAVPNPGSFLQLIDLDIDDTGDGALVGCAEVETDAGTETLWFVYRTTDGGASWSAPAPVAGRPPPPRGVFVSLGTAMLLADLRRSLG